MIAASKTFEITAVVNLNDLLTKTSTVISAMQCCSNKQKRDFFCQQHECPIDFSELGHLS